MSVAKKTQDEKKKKKSKPSKEKKSKSGVKSKHEKGQKVKKVESNAVIKNKKKKKKKKSKTSKSKTGESVPKETPSKQIIKEKKVKKLKKDGKKVAKTGGSKKSGSLIVDKTQSSVASTNEKKKEEPKKENMKEKKEEKVEPATPGSAKKIAPIPKKSNLYNIVGEYEDSKSMEKTPNINPKRSPPRKVESPEVKTPETVGPPMADEKEQKAILEKSKKSKEEPKEGTGYEEIDLTSDRDNLEEKPPEDQKKQGSGKKMRSESLKLKKTQSMSPTQLATPTEPKPLATPTEPKPLATPTEPKPLATPTEPKPPNPKSTEPNKETKKTPPGSKKEIKVRIKSQEEPIQELKVKQEDPGLDQPLPEEGFIKNYTDNRGKRFGLKKVNFDMIGRTGMYLERYGMPVETKAAFDWIAYNRHDVKKKGKEFQKNMAVALSGVGINKQLLIRTIVYLKTHEQITPAEMDNVLKEIESLNKEVVSFSQVSNALKKHCETYKTKQIEQMV